MWGRRALRWCFPTICLCSPISCLAKFSYSAFISVKELQGTFRSGAMSRATSQLASSSLCNLGEGTVEPQIPPGSWKDVPCTWRVPASTGFYALPCHSGALSRRRGRPRVLETARGLKIILAVVCRVLLDRRRNGKSSSVSGECQLMPLRTVPAKAWSENNV